MYQEAHQTTSFLPRDHLCKGAFIKDFPNKNNAIQRVTEIMLGYWGRA